MSTENVKILLRRGFRDEIASTTLDTGEMGFTTDTNQLFIGIDTAINEIQFDPFINAHAVIQTWLDSDDCSVPGLTVDEDLVIRNIPTELDEDGNTINRMQDLLDSMYFFTQVIELNSDSNIDLEIGELLYQKRYQHANAETVLSELTPGAVYRIFNLGDTDWSEIEDKVDKTYAVHDKILVRSDFDQWKSDLDDYYADLDDDYDWGDGGAVKVIGVLDYTKGKIVSKTDNELTLSLSEMDNDFVQEIPPSGKKYHNFNGNPAVDEPDDTLGELETDFGLFEYSSGSWNQVLPTQLDDDTQIADINSDGIAPPKDTYGENGDYVVVTSLPKITYWKKIEDSWKLLGEPIFEQEEVTIVSNSNTHPISDSLAAKIALYPLGTAKVTITKNKGMENEEVTPLTPDDFTIDGVNLSVLNDLDSADDTLVIEYIYSKDFQFSNVENPSHRSDSTDLQDGDCYIYTNRDIVGGLELNMFKWDGSNFKHNYIPAYETDAFAVDNASPGVLIYGKTNDNKGIIELRQRNSNGQFWFEFIINPIHMFYLSIDPSGSVNDNDTDQTIAVTDSSDFSAGYLGRPRTNVEVVTENTFNQLFADQHLSSLDVALGMRPSLYKKSLNVVNATINATACVEGNQYEIVSSVNPALGFTAADNTASVWEDLSYEASSNEPAGILTGGTYWHDTDSSVFGLFKHDGTDWVAANPAILNDEPGTGNVETINASGYASPTNTFGSTGDFAVVTSTARITYHTKIGINWVLLGDIGSPNFSFAKFAPTGASGDAYVRLTQQGGGLDLAVAAYNAASGLFQAVEAPVYDSDDSALADLITEGDVYTHHDSSLGIIQLRRHTGATTNVLTSDAIANTSSISTVFNIAGALFAFANVSLDNIVQTMQYDTTLNNANVLVEKIGNDRVRFTKTDGKWLSLSFTSGQTDFTDFTLNGATNSTVGTRFYANSTTPIGTGTVKQIGTGTFLRYNKGVCTTFFIDYSLVQTYGTSKFLRVGQIKVINGVPQGINQVKLTDDNTEIWQDNGDGIVEETNKNEFSNIEFSASIVGDNLEINYAQDENCTTEISYVVKRWSM
ncbi:hypothetical protein N8344_01525 [bacterium]|nr:hypothetical protein [bacterium]